MLKDGDKAAIDAKGGNAVDRLAEARREDVRRHAGAAAAGQQQAADNAKPVDDNVVDADFKEVKRDH